MGMGQRINTIMQTCFFAISGVLPRDEAIEAIKYSIKKTYGAKGDKIVEMTFHAVAYKVAADMGMGQRINTIMQTCFFAISGVLPRDEAIEAIKYSIKKTYGAKGDKIVQMNFQAVDQTRWPPRWAWASGSTRSCRPASLPSPACCRATKRSRPSNTPSRKPTAPRAIRSSR